jgi:hypothetical protein
MSRKYFWEDWGLMQSLSLERPEVYEQYMNRILRLARQGRMSKYHLKRLIEFARWDARKADEDLRRLRFLVNNANPMGLRVVKPVA